ncbi:MAG: amidohydrolase [bacterium]|nr:amidohydrolase [bacterium]
MGKKLVEIKQCDIEFYEKIKGFLPEKIIDIHTHVWRKKDYPLEKKQDPRVVSWPSRVARENPIEDLIETYKLMFPGKKFIPLIFANLPENNLEKINNYVCECSKKTGYPALIFSDPKWSSEELEEKIKTGGFLGAKSYMTMIPNVPSDQISIFDFFPKHHLDVHNKNGWIVMLHIPKDDRLKNPENLKNLIEIDEKYENLHLIVAHAGRAYCDEDAGDAFKVLKKTKRILFDISANTNENIFFQLIDCVGTERILFGSDMPITRMRMKRITTNGIYVNIVPKGLYGDVSDDIHMQEVNGELAEKLTFFLYEEIAAFKKAAEKQVLSKHDIEKIFYENACKILKKAEEGSGGKI